MKMKRSFRVMLCPNNKQETRLFQYAGTCRFIYNWALAKEMEALRNGSKRIGGFDLRKELTQMKKVPEYAWLNTVSNNVAKQAVKDLEAAYDRFFRIQRETNVKYTKKKLAHLARIGKKPTVYDMNGHPKFKKKGKTQPAFFQDGVKLQATETHVKLEGLAGSRKKNRQVLNWIRLAEKGRIPASKTYGNPRVTVMLSSSVLRATMNSVFMEARNSTSRLTRVRIRPSRFTAACRSLKAKKSHTSATARALTAVLN